MLASMSAFVLIIPIGSLALRCIQAGLSRELASPRGMGGWGGLNYSSKLEERSLRGMLLPGPLGCVGQL